MEGFKNEISSGFVVVDFYAPWCGDCVRIDPIIKELEKEYKIIKINIDENENLSNSAIFLSIPHARFAWK